MFKTKILLLSFLVLGLSACTEQASYDYLVRHPLKLKKEMDTCQTNLSQMDSPYCQVVKKAAMDFMEVLSEQQQDPELFGQKILATEEALGNLQTQKMLAQQKLNQLIANKASTMEIQAAHEKLAEYEKNYLAKKNELDIMLAVAGLSSPE